MTKKINNSIVDIVHKKNCLIKIYPHIECVVKKRKKN
jgi:hypothetical protein